MPELKIPTPLRPYAGGESTLALEGDNIAEVLAGAVEKHPELKKHLFDEKGQLRPFVNLILGEENINQLDGLQTEVNENDTLLIIPSIAGG